jgi:flagellar basal body rod protein FlgG
MQGVMDVSPALYSAAAGMAAAGRRLDTAAHNVANVSTEPFAPLRADGSQGPEGSLDLASELVEGTMLAPAAYAANAAMVRAADETQRSLLDIFA